MENLYDKFSGVIELTSKDFKFENDKVIVINKQFKDKCGLIKFYAPWCGHCKNMVETWSNLAIQFGHSFVIGAVNCEKKENYKIRSKLQIKYYPTIMRVKKDGSLSIYDMGTGKDQLMYYICSRI